MYQYFSKNPKRDHLRYRITVSGLIVSSVYALINFGMFWESAEGRSGFRGEHPLCASVHPCVHEPSTPQGSFVVLVLLSASGNHITS